MGLTLLHAHFIKFEHVGSIENYQPSTFTKKRNYAKKYIILNLTFNFFPQFHRAGKGKVFPSSGLIT